MDHDYTKYNGKMLRGTQGV